MKRVLLMRHAKSSWSDETLTDHERPLSQRGIRDAKRLAVYFEDKQLGPDYVLCSSATRARRTYALVAKRFRHEPEVVVDGAVYQPTAHGLIAAIRKVPDSVRCLLVVGHSPSLDALLLNCIGQEEAYARARIAAKFPTGSLCALELDAPSFAALGREPARVTALVTPRDLDPNPSKQAPKAQHAGPIALGSKSSLADAARLSLSDALLQVRQNAASLADSDEPELIHQLRVGLRRLRVALSLFDSALSRPPDTSLDENLRWLLRELGTFRDRDVFLSGVLDPAIATQKQPSLLQLRKRLLIERHAHLAKVRTALTSERYAALVSDLLALEGGLASTKDSPRLKSWARKALNRRLRKVLSHKGAIEQRDAAALHSLRRELKKLRYSAEFLRSVFPERKSQAALKHLSALQDVLGSLHDVTVGERVLKQSLKRIKAGRARTHARESLRTTFDGIATEQALELPRRFAAFEKQEPFWN